MNLSNYLQMPPAPLTPNSPPNSVAQGPRAGVGTSAGEHQGFDFAQVMAHQMAHLAARERQDLAAQAPRVPANTASDQATDDTRDEETSERPSRARDASVDTDTSHADDRHNTRTSSARTSTKRMSAKPEELPVDVLLQGLMQGAPTSTAETTPTTGTVTVKPDAAALVQDHGTDLPVAVTPAPMPLRATALQSIALSPQVRILTTPQSAPDANSLMAFAKAMGLDEAAVQRLMAQQPPVAATVAPATLASAVALPAQASWMAQAPNTPGAPSPAHDDMVALQLAAMTSGTPTPTMAASGTGLAAPASTLVAALPGLTPADMAAIEQVQITVMPTVALPAQVSAVNMATPSTLDMLSLADTGLSEQDVGALMTQFSQETGQENSYEQQPSPDEGQHFTAFSQALARHAPSNAATTTAASGSTPSMSEVYDQLSDKLATEMAARMHKQLSDGQWKMKFALRPSNLGGVEIQLEMKDGQLDAVFHADNPLTRDLLQNSSQRLREALGNFGINAGQVNVGQGGGNPAQSGSGNGGKQPQVRDNSSTQVNDTGLASGAARRHKANASLLDLYA